MKLSPFIVLTKHESVAVVQINRPKALNAMNTEMLKDLYDLLKILEQQSDVVIIKGLPKVFCVGGDLKSFLIESKGIYDTPGRFLDLIDNFKKPYVALMDGICLGGASMFTMTSRYRVVTERTKFAMPENAIGYFTDAGASFFLSRLEKIFGFYMALTGTRISGSEMCRLKLATHFVQSDMINDLEGKLIICRTHNDVLNVLNKFSTSPPIDPELESILPKVEKCFGSSTVEEIYENLESDGSDWAKKTIQILNKMSPTSLKVTHRFLKIGKSLSLRDNLRLEVRLITHYFTKPNSSANQNLKEGIRSVLVDKDFKPKWIPSTIKEVTKDQIDEIFKSSSESELFFQNERSHL